MTGGKFKDLGDGRIMLTPEPDEDGYTGRECPNEDCGRYFKIVTRVDDDDAPREYANTTCPYCGKKGTSTEFATRDQQEYGESVITRDVMSLMLEPLKKAQADLRKRPGGGGLLTLDIEINEPDTRLKNYRELQDLETHVTCDTCSNKYSIYGVYGYCPHCAAHNIMQILEGNLNLVGKLLALAEEQTGDFAENMIGNALEDCVSSLDGWGREVMRAFADSATSPGKTRKIRFQNLGGASEQIDKQFGFSLESLLEKDAFHDLITLFQKRHLISHRSGVVDDDYIKKTGDTTVPLGRKVKVTPTEISRAVEIMKGLSKNLMAKFDK